MSHNNEFDPIGGDGVPASPDAVPQEASPRIIITAQPIKWEPHPSGQQWTEDRYGYCITLEPEDSPETPYAAALGEGDPETFATLAEAQAWCQRDIDATVARWAVVAAQPPQAAPKAEAPAAPAERGVQWQPMAPNVREAAQAALEALKSARAKAWPFPIGGRLDKVTDDLSAALAFPTAAPSAPSAQPVAQSDDGSAQ